MKNYAKPALTEFIELSCENICADSGVARKCSKGRSHFNPHADECQKCNGSKYYFDGMYCKEGLPTKKAD